MNAAMESLKEHLAPLAQEEAARNNAFIQQCAKQIAEGTEAEAWGALGGLSIYLSYGLISKAKYNRLGKVLQSRFPST